MYTSVKLFVAYKVFFECRYLYFNGMNANNIYILKQIVVLVAVAIVLGFIYG